MKRSGIAVGCSALLGFVIMLHSYGYFSSGVTFIQIPEGFRGLAQRVRSVDARCDLAGLNELIQNNQVLIVRNRNIRASLLAHDMVSCQRREKESPHRPDGKR